MPEEASNATKSPNSPSSSPTGTRQPGVCTDQIDRGRRRYEHHRSQPRSGRIQDPRHSPPLLPQLPPISRGRRSHMPVGRGNRLSVPRQSLFSMHSWAVFEEHVFRRLDRSGCEILRRKSVGVFVRAMCGTPGCPTRVLILSATLTPLLTPVFPA